MSRIGKQPIQVPGGVALEKKGSDVTVKGPKGSLSIKLRPEVSVEVNGNVAQVGLSGQGAARAARAYHGMTRALLANMISGVVTGYEKKLEIVGIGWNAAANGPNKITLNIGFCHPVVIDLPAGVVCETPTNSQILLRGADKQAVGQVAANIRAVRPPEPYKGKGIRYSGEVVRRKAGKSFGA